MENDALRFPAHINAMRDDVEGRLLVLGAVAQRFSCRPLQVVARMAIHGCHVVHVGSVKLVTASENKNFAEKSEDKSVSEARNTKASATDRMWTPTITSECFHRVEGK